MHTFFINTSKKDLTGYDILFDIHYERKALVTMQYPLSEWYDPAQGYAACARRMGEMIDGYVELNNAFNLIIYLDLPENKAYSAIKRDEYHDKEREECSRAMHLLFTHVMRETLLADLTESGRKPANVLLMFGEEKQFADFRIAPNDPTRPAIMRKVFSFLGLPGDDEVLSLAKECPDGDASQRVAALEEKILARRGEEIIAGIRKMYATDLEMWYEEILHSGDIDHANRELFDRMQKTHRVESERIGIERISCPYDCYAATVNKSVLAISQLNIALHLLACMDAQSIYEEDGTDGAQKLIPFRRYRTKDVVPFLLRKKAIFAETAEQMQSTTQTYVEMNLVPALSEFDFSHFGLDQYGDMAIDLVVQDAEPEQQARTDGESPVIVPKYKALVAVVKGGRPLFTQEEYPHIDYTFEQAEDALRKKATPKEYIEQAKKVRMHHLDYLKKLKVSVSDILSSYAGKSAANKPALLQLGQQRYAVRVEGDKTVQDNRALESVEDIARKAYTSIVDMYMEFCAGRSVAVTDIEEQCDWFVSRIHQIRDSLNRIRAVAIGLLGGLLALYIPFVILQFNEIIKNAMTISVALGSLLLPILLMYGVFVAVTIAQKKKYKEAWKEFKEKSNHALADNAEAAQKYDQLLSMVIPALRWVYEYKLDVEYLVECCKVADAKVEHHRRKLRNRVTALANILGDLEYRALDDEPAEEVVVDLESIDFNASFCSGRKNPRFYTVIDSEFFHEEKR